MNNINKIGSGGFMNPDKIVEELRIKSGMTVADFGCGAGYFTIPVAKKIKNSGKIYAIDVLNETLEGVLSKAKLYDLLNIETIRANIETVGGSKIKSGSVDLVVLANILFQCNDHNSVLTEAKRILKNNGSIAIVDWIPQKVPLGPKYEHCLSEENVKKLSIKNGLKVVRKIDAGGQHYGMVLKVF